MKETRNIVKCPKCESEMNHHADKIITDVTEKNLKYFDETFDGILQVHFKCPECGFTLNKYEKEK